MIKIKRALLSVATKDDLTPFAAGLVARGVELIATGGTAVVLREAGVELVDTEEITGVDSALGGRLKTLHPALLGGILHDRDVAGQAAELEALGARSIDLVVVNFYPFVAGVADGKNVAELVELIDIGGPTMVRAAAKNYRHVVVVTAATDYALVLAQLKEFAGAVTHACARKLAAKAFALTARYEAAIVASFSGGGTQALPAVANTLTNLSSLAYGENPHQAAWLGSGSPGLTQLGGGTLSYNNVQDAIAAWRCVAEFATPACAVIKHANPCGVAVAASLSDAHRLALHADPVSAYGGVVACNREIDVATLAAIKSVFCEVLIAPSYSAKATALLVRAKRMKSLVGPLGCEGELDVRVLGGVALVQQRDVAVAGSTAFTQISKSTPSTDQVADLQFAWRVAKHARSNAIVLAHAGMTIGIGAGQSSRVEAVQFAIMRARAKGFDPQGCVVASDGFFPFADAVELLAKAGVAAIVQPGGSKRDAAVIASADAAGMVMVATGTRHFAH